MFEAVEEPINVAGHGNINIPFRIIPIKLETTVVLASPVDGDIIKLFQCMDEMVSIGMIVVLYTEVVDAKTEECLSSFVFPHPNGMRNRVVPKGCKVRFELFVRENGCLLQAVHSFINLEVHIVIVVHVIGSMVAFQDI